MARIWQVSEPKTPQADLVFVHGLMGGALSTWSHSNGFVWPVAACDEFATVRVISVDYTASPSRWSKGSLSIPEYAKSLGDLLHHNGVGNERPVFFVCHSLGGLIVKEMLRLAHTTSVGERFPYLRLSVRGIVFLGTPHRGSPPAWMLRIACLLMVRPSPVVIRLRSQNPSLAECHEWFKDAWGSKALNCEVFAYGESRPLFGLTVVVPRHSADPELAGVPLISLEADHSEVCKPESRRSQTYLAVRQMIERAGVQASPRPQVPQADALEFELDFRCRSTCRRVVHAEGGLCRHLRDLGAQRVSGSAYNEDDARVIERISAWLRDRCGRGGLLFALIALVVALFTASLVLVDEGADFAFGGSLLLLAFGTILARRRVVIRRELRRSASEGVRALRLGLTPHWSQDVYDWLDARGVWRWLS